MTHPPAESVADAASVPANSTSVASDIRSFILHRPAIPTQVSVESDSWREDYTRRIAERTGVDVSVYSILNIHRIGIDAAVETVFDEVERWEGGSACWPDHLATIEQTPGEQDGFRVVFLGRSGTMRRLRRRLGPEFGTLFVATVSEARRVPDLRDTENARFFLWNCSGGYPIGVFSIFARSRIAERGETAPTQLFFAVGFNPYGSWTLGRIGGPFRSAWQFLHDRVTSNVLNRFKQLCEFADARPDGSPSS
ncbi:MAG: hypothetical protein M8867_03255 [marine benthic group bacterium]|nr:hypothetical protein [Gemmatimonadota bacterium]